MPRKAFNFYRSYFDIAKKLPVEDREPYLMAILEMQFEGVEPDHLTGMAEFAFISQKHSLVKQLEGYKHGLKGGAPPKGDDNPPPKGNDNQVQVQGKEQVQEESIIPPNKVDVFDWDNLRKRISLAFGRQFKTINKTVQGKYKARIKEGYTKEDIINAIANCKNDEFHKEKNYKHCTPEYFSRSKTLDLHSKVQDTPTQIPRALHSNPVN